MDFKREDSESGFSYSGSFSEKLSLSSASGSEVSVAAAAAHDGGASQVRGWENAFASKSWNRRGSAGRRLLREYPSSFLCKQHLQESPLFCVECNVPVCGKCVATGHGKCHLKSLEAHLSHCKASLVKEDQVEIEAIKNFVLTTQGIFEHKVRAIVKEINDITVRLISEIEGNKKELLYKVEYMQRTKAESWKGQIALCESVLKDLQRFGREVEALDMRDIVSYRKGLAKKVGAGLHFIEDDYIQFSSESVPRINLGQIKGSVSPKHSILIKPTRSFSHTFNTCSVIVRDHANEPVDGDDDFTISVTMFDANRRAVYFVIDNMRNGIFKVRYYPLVEGTCALNVSLNSVPIAGSPCNLEVVKDDRKCRSGDSSLIICQSDGGETFFRPWGICCDYEGRILAVDRGHHCVKIFKESGEFLYKFGREGTGTGEFNRPAGIAVDPNLRRIVISDKDNHRIQVFTYEGAHVLSFGKNGHSDASFNYPWDVAVNRCGDIAVADSKNSRVQLFTKDGKLLRKFCFLGKFWKERELPRGLAFRPDGTLLVTEFNGHRIFFINDKFEFIKVFGREGSGIAEFSRPQGIAVNERGMIAVADGKNHRIQVFTPNLALVAIIGTLGREPGEFDSPQGIGFLPDGRIMVTELGNNRVQILKIPY